MHIQVVQGDLTRTTVDTIVTLVNPGGLWWGNVDNAIRRVAGTAYHDQALQPIVSHGLPYHVVRGNKKRHNGDFDNVLFVTDDLTQPIGFLTSLALNVAMQENFSSIAFPAMRTGVMLGAYSPEPTLTATVRGIFLAMRSFMEKNPNSQMAVYFVVYQPGDQLEEYNRFMKLLG